MALARQRLRGSISPLLYPNIQFLNADEIQRETSTPSSSVAAGKELLRRLGAAESSHVSFAVETTLASRMYISHVRRWNLAGSGERAADEDQAVAQTNRSSGGDPFDLEVTGVLVGLNLG